MTLAELDGLAPNFQWSAYFAGIDAPKVSDLNVGQPDFFKGKTRLSPIRASMLSRHI